MDLSNISSKHSNELEQLITQLLKTMRNAKLQDTPLYAELQLLEQSLGELRRNRYDEKNSKFVGY
jgi:hypothetical protein